MLVRVDPLVESVYVMHIAVLVRKLTLQNSPHGEL